MKKLTEILILIFFAAMLTACQTTGKVLDSAEKVLGTTTAQTIGSVASSKDPEEAVKEGLKRRGDTYVQSPQTVIQDIRTIKKDYDTLMSVLRGKVSKTWGKKEVKLPSRKQYIKYTQNYKSRAIVDFDAGEVTVETVDDKEPQVSLKNAIVTTLLTPNDPRAVDLFSDNAVKLTGEKEPYLFGLVVDQNNKPIAMPAEAEGFADYLMEKAGNREVEIEDGKKSALFVKIQMVPNFEDKQAEKFKGIVAGYADEYKISQSLVFAIIKTESNFNPFAVSSAPAYGLMQLVPASGGREAYRKAKGQDEMPSKEYLFDAKNNIELGTAYLNVLTYSQLEAVGNAVSREYCVISAYNTGPSNVLRTFSKDKVDAVNMINGMQPANVYEKLRSGLPYEETREYLYKVVNSRKRFVSLTE